jgi:hypothetical protein
MLFLRGFLLPLLLAAAAPSMAAEIAVVWDIADGRLAKDQRVLKIQKGDMVHLTVSSAQPGVLHLHAYRLVIPVSKEPPSKKSFQAHASGKFRFEWHAKTEGKGKTANDGNHHAEPLATLEVRPN